jgi:hypothetical protein
MKKLQMTVAIVMLLGLLFSAANVFANPTTESKPRQTPGAQPTEKVGRRTPNAARHASVSATFAPTHKPIWLTWSTGSAI